MIGFITWPLFSHLNYYKGGQVTKPIILVKICYELLHVNDIIQGVKYFDSKSNFLASADIKVFGRPCLFAMLLLNGLSLFYIQGLFV